MTAHATQIAKILLERSDVSMSAREHELYERIFLPHGFTPRQFLRLLQDSGAEWVTLPPGKRLCERGGQVSHLHLVTGGSSSACMVR